ncbi:hypothetical protein MtrunA17_Chr3g0084001 [Medicago truncatula]|uniref:Uncharacterized protein n=1 Tax=Medicago truncatula TaxID=3880 RepID=A0A396IJM2_MEDTR|nr:hypothetical protein MtrunA17_Chr3g0084001 [Medicago truncatula]
MFKGDFNEIFGPTLSNFFFSALSLEKKKKKTLHRHQNPKIQTLLF